MAGNGRLGRGRHGEPLPCLVYVADMPDIGAVFHKVHAVFSQPVKTLEEEKEREECDKAGAEVIPKDGEGQTSLSDSIPRTLQKVLEVGRGMMQT